MANTSGIRKKRSGTPTAANETTSILVQFQAQIGRRAYELYEQRGREDGHAVEDWLKAESELLKRYAA